MDYNNLARSYFEVVRYLLEGPAELTNDLPVYQNLGLGLEISFKAWMKLFGRSEEELKQDFGHNLVKLFQALRSVGATAGFMEAVDREVRNTWRTEMREGRDRVLAKRIANHPLGCPPKDFNVSNADIGSVLPDFRSHIPFVAEIYSVKDYGRYFASFRVENPNLAKLGLNKEIAPWSLLYGGENLVNLFEAEFHKMAFGHA